MVRVRPMDRIRMIENRAWEQDRRLENVGHSHFVKVSYDQLPVDMQQRILAANTTNRSDHGTSRLCSRHGSAHSMSQMSSQQRQISSSLRKTTANTRPTSTRVNRSSKQRTEQSIERICRRCQVLKESNLTIRLQPRNRIAAVSMRTMLRRRQRLPPQT